ncbi:restriction endonuclease subunit S [Bacteroides salyersiae]|uniref:restriction endonuclease subunit S n=1 Tax=Bacteroides salyersiae TaxID=291644 RepID=UPI00189B77BA|nr:restriction endonuclease subunit S [Bacteroides salyersiae]
MDTKKLRQKILDLAIHGKLVPQDPNDEPASVLLEQIKAEKERLIEEGKIKRSKKSAKTSDTPHYENVPFEVPEGWVWTTIEEICSKIGSGSTPRGSNYSATGIPFFRSQNVYNDRLVYDDIKYISEEVHQKMKGTEVLANDLLLNITGGSLGRCAVVPADFNCGNVSQHVCIMRSVLVEPEYFHALVLSSCFAKSMKITGSGREGLPKYNLEQMRFPLPPLTEQQRIVAEIEHWFALIAQIEQGKADLQIIIKQTKSKILNLAIHGKLVPQDPNDEPAIKLLKRINPDFTPCDNGHYPFDVPNGWNWCKLNDLCLFLSRGKSPKYSETDKTYPVFAQKCNLKEGGISLEQARFLDPSTVDKWDSKYKLQTGDVLVNSTGTGTVGRTRLFDESCLGKYPFVVPDSHVSVIRTFEEIRAEYVFAYMSSQFTQLYIEENLAGSTNQKELYIGVLENLNLPLPPLAEQQRIVQKIEELFSVLDNIQNALEV